MVPEGPLPTCRKHDVAFGSLQKFSGLDSTEEFDRTWNPRNKALADAKFWADIVQYGCLGAGGNEEIVCASGNRGTAAVYFWGVARHNNKGWPVTTQDLDHARAHRDGSENSADPDPSTHTFFDCSGPVPRLEGLSVRRDTSGDFRATWTYQPGCVSGITIDSIRMDFKVYFEGAWEPSTARERLYNTTTTSVQFDIDSYEDHTPVAVAVKVYFHPDDREYGGKAYEQDILLFLEPQLH